MLSLFKWTFLLFMTFAYPSFALSQWIYKKEENAFDEKKSTHIAVTANSRGYAFGARCINGSLSIMYITPEKDVGKSTISLMNMSGTKIMFRADKMPTKEFDITLDTVDEALVAILEEEDAKSIMQDIIESKDRISVSLKILDKMFHTNNFVSKGSGASLRKVLDGCKG